MAKAGNTQALGILSRIYRFAGGLRSPGEVDIERPVTVVHDVAPSAQRLAGFFMEDQALDLIIGPSDTDRATRTRAQIMDLFAEDARNLGLTSRDSLFWMRTALFANPTADNLSSAGIGWSNWTSSQPTVIGSHTGKGLPLLAGGWLPIWITGVQPHGYPPVPFPILLRDSPDSAIILRLTSSAGGNLEVRAINTFWWGPKGSTPPRYTP